MGAHLVVLGNNHVSILGEVEVEGRLVCAQIVDMEDQALVHARPVTPDNPANARVHQPIPDTDKDTFGNRGPGSVRRHGQYCATRQSRVHQPTLETRQSTLGQGETSQHHEV